MRQTHAEWKSALSAEVAEHGLDPLARDELLSRLGREVSELHPGLGRYLGRLRVVPLKGIRPRVGKFLSPLGVHHLGTDGTSTVLLDVAQPHKIVVESLIHELAHAVHLQAHRFIDAIIVEAFPRATPICPMAALDAREWWAESRMCDVVYGDLAKLDPVAYATVRVVLIALELE